MDGLFDGYRAVEREDVNNRFTLYILVDYFVPTKDGDFVYKEGKDASNCTRRWMNVGFIWLILMSMLLIASSILMILHILSLQPSLS